MAECRGCGAEIEFVEVRVKVKGEWREKAHPVDTAKRKVPWGRVVYLPDVGAWELLDARLVKRADGTIDVRGGASWPVDGGAYESHFDTCPDVAEQRRIKRRGRPRTDEEEEARDLEDANAHIPRCRVCQGSMEEYLAADEAWFTHPSCDPAHRLAELTVEERNRLTGRRDVRARDAPPAEVVVAVQQEATRTLATARLRRVQEVVDTEWRQLAIGTGWGLAGEEGA